MRRAAVALILVSLTGVTAFSFQAQPDTGPVALTIRAAELIFGGNLAAARSELAQAEQEFRTAGHGPLAERVRRLNMFLDRMSPLPTHPPLALSAAWKLIGEARDGETVQQLYLTADGGSIHRSVFLNSSVDVAAVVEGLKSFLNEKGFQMSEGPFLGTRSYQLLYTAPEAGARTASLRVLYEGNHTELVFTSDHAAAYPPVAAAPSPRSSPAVQSVPGGGGGGVTGAPAAGGMEPVVIILALLLAGTAALAVLIVRRLRSPSSPSPIPSFGRLRCKQTGREFRLKKTATLIGRSPHCDVVFDEPTVSREHAEVVVEAGGHLLRNLSLTNPILLNGEPVGKAVLRSGDRIGIGSTALVYEGPE